jgi:hypothetical protein
MYPRCNTGSQNPYTRKYIGWGRPNAMMLHCCTLRDHHQPTTRILKFSTIPMLELGLVLSWCTESSQVVRFASALLTLSFMADSIVFAPTTGIKSWFFFFFFFFFGGIAGEAFVAIVKP